MKRDEIIEMTRQAGGFDATPAFLERFAKLVAAKEREACAKSLENSVEATSNFQAKVLIEWCATHIRARGEA
jgi:hypothetical protein